MKVNRRDAIRTAIGAGAAACAALETRAAAQPKTLPRKSVGSLAATGPELTTLRTAIGELQKKSLPDRRSWEGQATIHRDFCPHQNWFFFPWHRAYLASFERLCQAVSGNADFRLPYWNWTADTQIPAPFWDTSSVLSNQTRAATANSTTDPELVGQRVIDGFLSTSDFETAAGKRAIGQRDMTGAGLAEGGPHNEIHNFVGGDMATWMSPLDPIFWLHHANVDRLWSAWMARNPHAPDGGWLAHQFKSNFVAPDGTDESPRVRDVINSRSLGYYYDTEPAAGTPTSPVSPHVSILGVGGFNRSGTMSEPIEASIKGQLPVSLIDALKMPPALQQTTLRIQIDKLQQVAGAKTRVFLNCPYLSASTPIDDPHYVTTISFFPQHPGHDVPMTVLVNGAGTIQRLARLGRPEASAPLDVQVIAVPAGNKERIRPGVDRLAPGGVEIALIRRSGIG
jgi:tyrosinase